MPYDQEKRDEITPLLPQHLADGAKQPAQPRHPSNTRKYAQWIFKLALAAAGLWAMSTAGPELALKPGNFLATLGRGDAADAVRNTKAKLPHEDDLDIVSQATASALETWAYACITDRRRSTTTAAPRQNSLPIGKLAEIQCWKEYDYDDLPGSHCFRMAAPLDYTNQSDSRRASIALFKYEAGGGKTPRDRVLGTVFVNPGGPGGSGIQLIRSRYFGGVATGGQVLDAMLESRYDIVGWDPRGVEKTWPRANCLDDAETSYANTVFHYGADLYHASSASLPRQVAWDNFLAATCEQKLGDELRFVTTASVVRDMRLMYQAVDDVALNYIGFSYGTVLGAHYADMFPSEVGRFWLDGVLEVHSYTSGAWDANCENTDDVVEGFFQHCANAGADNCALVNLLTEAQRKADDKGASILSDLYFRELEHVRVNPRPELTGDFPQLSTYIGLKSAMFMIMYTPDKWPGFAQLLALGLGMNNWAPFLQYFGLQRYKAPATADALRYRSDESQWAIACGDATQKSAITPGAREAWDADRLEAHILGLEKTSPFSGELWGQDGGMCEGAWRIQGNELWQGGFNSTPAFPILWTSNDLDPATPLAGARRMAKRFGGSEMIRVEGGIGHTTTAMPSKCESRYVADYFVRGTLPSAKSGVKGTTAAVPETVCKADLPPFMPRQPALSAEEMAELSAEERIRLQTEEAQASLGSVMANWRSTHGTRFKF